MCCQIVWWPAEGRCRRFAPHHRAATRRSSGDRKKLGNRGLALASSPFVGPGWSVADRVGTTDEETETLETDRTAYALGPEEGEALWGADGALTTVKATGEQTGGRFAIIEDVAPKGEGTPLHAHREDDETSYVLEGELTFYLGDDRPVRASAGSFIHVPGGVAHAFRVDSDTARYLIITTPRHGRFYRAISEPAPARVLPPAVPLDMEKVEAACQAYGVEVLGPPPGAGA